MATPEKRVRNGKVRWYARYRDTEGRQRAKSFERRSDAQAFLNDTLSDLRRGRYLDPDAGTITFKAYADQWVAEQYAPHQQGTKDAVELRLRLHVYPVLGSKPLAKITTTTMRSWVSGLRSTVTSERYRRVIFANVSSVLAAALEEDRIRKNPCAAETVRKLLRSGETTPSRVAPWTHDQVAGVRDALPTQYQIMVTLGAGLGLRQGEVFGLSPDDVDFLRGVVQVRRQVKVLGGNRLILALPKGRKTREVPLPSLVREPLALHLAAHPAREITLPWDTLDGDSVTVPLVVSSREGKALNRNYVNTHLWKPALREAGIPDSRVNGMHALRHWYASVLLDGGESIKALSTYLGHADPGFTLRVYTHLMPASDERTRRAVDAALAGEVPASATTGG